MHWQLTGTHEVKRKVNCGALPTEKHRRHRMATRDGDAHGKIIRVLPNELFKITRLTIDKNLRRDQIKKIYDTSSL